MIPVGENASIPGKSIEECQGSWGVVLGWAIRCCVWVVYDEVFL